MTFGSSGRRDTPSQRNNLGFLSQVEHWKICSYRLRDIARCQVRIVFLGHAGVGMSELGGNYPHRHPGVCTENLGSGVVVVKSAKDGV